MNSLLDTLGIALNSGNGDFIQKKAISVLYQVQVIGDDGYIYLFTIIN